MLPFISSTKQVEINNDFNGKGKESDPTDASANTLADASANTLLTRQPIHYRRIDKKLTFSNCYFVTSFSWRQEQLHQKRGKHES